MTSIAVLKSLTLSAFRGASTTFRLGFEKGKTLTLIYGENGTGKTAICDAFEFLATEKVGSIEDRGMGKGLEQFWPTAGKAPKDLTVELETSIGLCSGHIVEKKVVVTPPSAKPRIELLRRPQILRLIEAQPAGRYNEVKRFIDIEAFERSEESLRQFGKDLVVKKEQACRLERENLETLQSFSEAAKEPIGSNSVFWARQKLDASATNLDADIIAIEKLRKKFAALEGFPNRTVAALEARNSAQIGFNAAENAVIETLKLASEDADDLLRLLEAGQSYLHAYPTTEKCPLCESVEKIGGLTDAIKERLERFSALKNTNAERQKRLTILNKAKDAFQQIVTNYAIARKEFLDVVANHIWRPDFSCPDSSSLPIAVDDLGGWLTASASITTSWPELEAAWRGEHKFVAALKSAVEQYDTNHDRRIALEALAPRVEKALRLCVAARQTFTDNIIKDIAQEVGRLYETIHSGEGLNMIALLLDPDKRASLEIKVSFSGHDAPPQAYFSQSHLDTLGLCVFLALALRDRPEETILILDDVLGSMDEPHVERAIQMIYGESRKFLHTIVTTHYRPWREKYRWGWLRPDQPCQFIELSGWRLDEGIRVQNSRSEIDRLKTLLTESPIDLQTICSKAGVILEVALDYLTQQYECHVPRRPRASYTLNDLLSAINGKLRASLKVEILDAPDESRAFVSSTVDLGPILDELTRIAQVRNVFGAHFKEISFEMLDSDAIRFAKHVVILMDTLTHPDHGWPNNDKSGSYWRNSGDTRRLHPLKKPG